MNLAILIARFPPGPQGGAEHQAECWAVRLAPRHRVTVITRQEPGGPAGRERRPEGFDVVRLPLSPVPLWKTWRDAVRAERAVRELEPRPDLLLCFQSFVSGWIGVRIQRRLGIPAVVWIRGECEYLLHERSVKNLINLRTWREARGVLVQSEDGRQALLDALDRHARAVRAPVAGHLDVVPNGIDLPALPVPAIERAAGPVLAVGRLIQEKGMDVVVEAAAAAGRRLVLAGEGPERARLEARAMELGLDARLLGFVPRAGLGGHYASAFCTVLAARRGEGLPNVVLEAMAWGCPVVATPIAGVRGLVVDGVNGFIVPPGDPEALRAALTRLAGDPAMARRMGQEARRTAEGYAWERVQPRLLQMLERWRMA